MSNFVVPNFGVSFGIELPLILVILFNALILVLFLRKRNWGLLLISVGGLLNLADRLRFGYVRDYWNFLNLGIYNNLNDWIIGVGVILFFIEAIWIRKSK